MVQSGDTDRAEAVAAVAVRPGINPVMDMKGIEGYLLVIARVNGRGDTLLKQPAAWRAAI